MLSRATRRNDPIASLIGKEMGPTVSISRRQTLYASWVTAMEIAWDRYLVKSRVYGTTFTTGSRILKTKRGGTFAGLTILSARLSNTCIPGIFVSRAKIKRRDNR
jgi:hypothetical protein